MNTAEILARLLLADEFGEPLRAQRGLRRVFLAPFGRDEACVSVAGSHRSGPRLYLFGNKSPIGTAAAARPFGTMTRALGS